MSYSYTKKTSDKNNKNDKNNKKYSPPKILSIVHPPLLSFFYRTFIICVHLVTFLVFFVFIFKPLSLAILLRAYLLHNLLISCFILLLEPWIFVILHVVSCKVNCAFVNVTFADITMVVISPIVTLVPVNNFIILLL